jgi:hypothetical protein
LGNTDALREALLVGLVSRLRLGAVVGVISGAGDETGRSLEPDTGLMGVEADDPELANVVEVALDLIQAAGDGVRFADDDKGLTGDGAVEGLGVEP